MKTKLYVGIALLVFIVCLLVIYSAGFTQDYMLRQEANQQLLLNKQDNCTIVNIILNNETVMVLQTNQTVTGTTKNTTTTTAKNTTPVVAKPAPKPVPKPPVTRAS